MRQHFLFSDRPTRALDDISARSFVAVLCRNTNDGCIDDLRVRQQSSLYLRWRYLPCASLDQFLLAIDNVLEHLSDEAFHELA